jgi:uncharacterized protein (TIGR02217 family)
MSDATFPMSLIAFGLSVAPAYSTQIVTTTGGHEQRNAQWSTPLRRWRLPLSNMTEAERVTLVAFIEARRGAWDSFLLTDPVTSTQYRVRFADDAMDVTTQYFQGHFADVDIVQVRDTS